MFSTNQIVEVVNHGPSDDGSIGIVCRGSDDATSNVYLIRGPYWKAGDLLMMKMHTRRSGVYLPTRCLKASDAKLTEDERANLSKYWNAHGFDPAQVP